jgi:hypothetical protein
LQNYHHNCKTVTLIAKLIEIDNTNPITICDASSRNNYNVRHKNYNFIENSIKNMPRMGNAMSITSTNIMIAALIVIVIAIRGFYCNLLSIKCYIGTITKHYNELK